MKKIKFKSLDAFRGLAALVIVMYHSVFFSDRVANPIVQNGGVFVDFFFILSGFVMAYSYQDKIRKSISFREFFLYRFGRLYPLHFFVLLLWIPYIGVKTYAYQHGLGATDPLELNNLSTLSLHLFLMQGLGFMDTSLSWNYPSWSISTEFYTYMVFFLITSILSFRKTLFFVVLICLTFILLYFTYAPEIESYSAISFIRCLGGFFAGVLVYNIYKITQHLDIRHVLGATLLEFFLLSSTLYLVAHINDHYIYEFLTILSFMSVIYFFALQNAGFVSQILELRPFQTIGKLSYSIYMVHALILLLAMNTFEYIFKFKVISIETQAHALVFEGAFLVNAVLIIVVVVVSWFTYYKIELPWQEKFRNYANK